ncbi:hypothetical protein ACOMHN_009601 [Nucella lapillus]
MQNGAHLTAVTPFVSSVLSADIMLPGVSRGRPQCGPALPAPDGPAKGVVWFVLVSISSQHVHREAGVPSLKRSLQPSEPRCAAGLEHTHTLPSRQSWPRTPGRTNERSLRCLVHCLVHWPHAAPQPTAGPLTSVSAAARKAFHRSVLSLSVGPQRTAHALPFASAHPSRASNYVCIGIPGRVVIPSRCAHSGGHFASPQHSLPCPLASFRGALSCPRLVTPAWEAECSDISLCGESIKHSVGLSNG